MQPNVRSGSHLKVRLLFLVGAVALISVAHAEMRVIESNTPRYPVNAIVQDVDKGTLGRNCYVRVLKLPANETILFEGPKSPRLPVGGTRGIRPEPPPPC